MDAVMSMIQTQVIQAWIKWILGLLSPVGAFVKAALAIVDVVKFFMQRAAQIAELVDAFVSSVAAIASGKVGAVAKAIEGALGKAVPVLIGLLASILGIGGITDKVLGLIRKIRKRITVAITNFWIKVKKGAGKLLRRIGFGKKDKREKGGEDKLKEIEIWEDKVPFINIEDEKHTLYFKEKGGKEELYMQSKDDHVINHLNNAKNIAATDSEKSNVEAGLSYYEQKVLPLNIKLSKLENERVKLLKDKKNNEQKIITKNKIIAEKNNEQDNILEKLAELFKVIKFEDKVLPTTVKTKVVSEQDELGRPKYVEASPLTWIAGNTKGSSPYQKIAGWNYAQDVEEIRSGIYIRGHMLNDNIHGPGVTWNLVPITRVMNSNMEVQAESKGKEVLLDGNRHRVMWYKTTIVDYFDDSNNPYDVYFPTEVLIEWGEYKNKKGEYDTNGTLHKIDKKKFKQGRPALPYNINDLGETLLKTKLGINAKFAKSITEERKANGWFNDQDSFEDRMDSYYENRKDNHLIEKGLSEIEILVSNTELIFKI